MNCRECRLPNLIGFDSFVKIALGNKEGRSRRAGRRANQSLVNEMLNNILEDINKSIASGITNLGIAGEDGTGELEQYKVMINGLFDLTTKAQERVNELKTETYK